MGLLVWKITQRQYKQILFSENSSYSYTQIEISEVRPPKYGKAIKWKKCSKSWKIFFFFEKKKVFSWELKYFLLSKESYFQKSNSHITDTEENVLLPATPLSQWGFALEKGH